MPEKIQEILKKILDWWKAFSTKQKMLIVSIFAVVMIALIILAAVMSRPTTIELLTCDSTAQASEVKTLLDGDSSINYSVSQDGLTFTVDLADESTARILLGANSIPSNGYSIDDVFSGGFSSTEADKNKKYQVYLQEKYAQDLEALDNVKGATVNLSIPTDDGTLIAQNQDTYASVRLQLDGEMTEEQAATIAQFVATEVGNDTAENVLVMDSSGNVLYSGADTSSSIGVASSQLSYQSKAESKVKDAVKDVILGSNVYSNVEVGLNLKLDFDAETVKDHNYYINEDQDEPYKSSEHAYESNSTNGAAATPGTDSNDAPTYVMEDSDVSESSVTDITNNYQPSEKLTESTKSIGDIVYDESSISVLATNYVVYDEDTLKADGTLDDMTFDEFVVAHNDPVKTTVDPDFYSMVATATGLSQDSITITAYDVPFFDYSDSSGRSVTDYLAIVLTVLIFALLGYVVFRSTRKDEVAEIEPELSVEALLETTKEAEQEDLADIGFSEKSETRVLIEKFVEENPEAAASLLRNWLNEEWN